MSLTRLAVVVVLVVVAGVAARTMPLAEPAAALDLSALPHRLGEWSGADEPPPDDETLAILKADATLHRTYVDAAGAPVGLYAAYYARQRPGVSVHSPLHCLPGTGWEPLEVGTLPLSAAGSDANGSMRRMVVRKGRERALVLYWYSVNGRTTGSEVASKLLMLAGHARLQPGGASLVRIVVPANESLADAEAQALAFAGTLLPRWVDLQTD
jgi:EpsI family protein